MKELIIFVLTSVIIGVIFAKLIESYWPEAIVTAFYLTSVFAVFVAIMAALVIYYQIKK